MIKQCLHFDYNEKLLKTKKQDADIIGVEKCYTSRELGGVLFAWIFIEIKQTNSIEIVCVA